MSEETQERIFKEIANKCGLLTQNHIAFQSNDNTAFRDSLSTTGHFYRMHSRLTWAVWVFVDYSTIHVQSKSRYTNGVSGDYSISQLDVVIEDINKFIKEIKLRRIKERIRDIDKDFIDEESNNIFHSIYNCKL